MLMARGGMRLRRLSLSSSLITQIKATLITRIALLVKKFTPEVRLRAALCYTSRVWNIRQTMAGQAPNTEERLKKLFG